MINQQLNYGAALFFAIIVLSVAFCQVTSKKYGESNNRVAEMLSEKTFFSYADLNRVIATDAKDQFLIVDLRPTAAFEKGHLPGAINIPGEELLERSHRRTFKGKKPVLLYAEQEHRAVAAQALLLGMGYQDIQIIPGGFETIRENVMEGFNPQNAFYSGDKARFDFPRFMKVQAKQSTEQRRSTQPTPDAPEPAAIPGGC